MEYDNQFLSMKRSKIVSNLRPDTLNLIKHYSKFYAIEPDQLVDTAVSTFVSKDDKFLEFLREKAGK